MTLFDDTIKQINKFADQKADTRSFCRMQASDAPVWPSGGDRDVVLRGDTALELGGPKADSFALLLWTDNPDLVTDGRITRIGPDFNAVDTMNAAFARVLIVCGSDFDETNAYERFVELSLIAYEVSLKGYMMRTASQQNKEWVRISREALERGFDANALGRALVDACCCKDYVTAAETVMVVGDAAAVATLRDTGANALQYISAMRKMAEEMTFDCNSCEYQSVCDGVSELKAMAARLEQQKRNAGGTNG
ncbi:MAG: hypothetical protein SWH61_01745 [Thermodesulfobacteriota bacterium]|nr:hypothetical protein [Thermodesulfobacteriota bacterium]